MPPHLRPMPALLPPASSPSDRHDEYWDWLAVACGFAALLGLLRRTPIGLRPGFALAVEVWLGLLVAAGFVVFVNNLSAVVHGVSLL